MRTRPVGRVLERRGLLATAVGLFVLAGPVTGPASAHVGTLESTATESPIPQWFVVLVAGAVVGASFLFTSMMADHDALRWFNGLSLRVGLPSSAWDVASVATRLVSVATLFGVIGVGLLGPRQANTNAASLLLWVGWWGGFTITTYTVGNSWPGLDPFRTLARLVPGTGQFTYPEEYGVWPAVVGLLAIVWVEVVSGATERPRILALLVVGYLVATVGGVALVGREDWFVHVDPVSAVFRTYGRLAPLQRTETGIELRLPGTPLTDPNPYEKPGQVAFVLALLWATTFDGFVSTPLWRTVLAPVVSVGLPALLGYVVVLVGGFAAFYGIYLWAAQQSRESADTYVTARAIARWLAPSLVPIAAGYHIAHFLGYVLSLSPALLAALRAPLADSATIQVLVLPDWFGFLQLGFVLGGHLLAIWVAHSLAFDLFPGARQPIRSQYPLIVVMIAYTLVSAWVIVAPSIPTPYV